MVAEAKPIRSVVAAISALLFVGAISGCSNSQTVSDKDETSLSDEDQADEPAVDTSEIKGGETYSAYDERRDEIDPSPGSVGDYGCTQDCSGHHAGYRWASQHSISSVDDCGGKSWSFEEGCKAYAEEQTVEE